MRALLLLVLCCVACGPDTSADPLRVALRVHPGRGVGATITWDKLTVGARAMRLRPCAQRVDRLDWPGVPGDVAGLPRAGSPPGTEARPRVGAPQPWIVGLSKPYDALGRLRLRAPLGPFCQMDLVMTAGVEAHGSLPDGTQVDLSLELPDLGMPDDASFGERIGTVEGDKATTKVLVTPMVVELGTETWLLPIEGDLNAGTAVSVAPGDAAHDALVAGLIAGAALYVDLSGEGQLSDKERAAGALSGLLPLTDSVGDGDTDQGP